MSQQLTTKGIEVEQFVGCKKTGEILALSPIIKKALPQFMTEPDARNIEYATEPSVDYRGLLYELLHNRMLLRDFLQDLAKNIKPEEICKVASHEIDQKKLEGLKPELTIIPGSCISHEFDQEFKFSDPENPYYKIIRDRYQTSIVTTSLHINFGTADSETAIWLANSMRLIASQVLAISASSPFHNGKVTGYKSYRWHNFPKTPTDVPIFSDLEHFINWNHQKVESGEMFNVRHLWTAVRPNGPTRPHVLNRVELRIPEFMFDCCQIIGLTAYLEMYFLNFLENGPPKVLSQNGLADILESNEEKVAKDGYEAKIFDWLTESEMSIKEQIMRDYDRFRDQAKNLGIQLPYNKLEPVIENGNFSEHMLRSFAEIKNKDRSLSDDEAIREILIKEAIKQENIDREIFQSGELVSTCD